MKFLRNYGMVIINILLTIVNIFLIYLVLTGKIDGWLLDLRDAAPTPKFDIVPL